MSSNFLSIKRTQTPRRLLYAGQLTSLKGVHTAVQALKIVVEDPAARSTLLTIVGGPDYDDRIHGLVASLRLENNVRFTGSISRDRLPALIQKPRHLPVPFGLGRAFQYCAP